MNFLKLCDKAHTMADDPRMVASMLEHWNEAPTCDKLVAMHWIPGGTASIHLFVSDDGPYVLQTLDVPCLDCLFAQMGDAHLPVTNVLLCYDNAKQATEAFTQLSAFWGQVETEATGAVKASLKAGKTRASRRAQKRAKRPGNLAWAGSRRTDGGDTGGSSEAS